MGGETKDWVQPSKYPAMAQGPVAKQFHPIYKDRLSNFSGGGQYAGDNLRSKLHEATAAGEPSVVLSVYSPPDLSRPSFKDATSHKFKPAKIGESFGPSWSTHWFKVQITVPKELRDKDHLELHWNANNEGLIWTEDGDPVQGLTGGGEREEWILPSSYRNGKQHTIYIEMACNGMFGNPPGGDVIQPPDPNKRFVLEKAQIVAVNLQARALFFDFWIIKDAAREFPDETWQQHKALQVCNRIMNCFDVGGGGSQCIQECREIAKEYLGSHVDSAQVYDHANAEKLVDAIGNCHIDTCWLWPWDETKRKIARSWSNQCDLLDRYPEHRFACSQAQQFKWLKMYYPSLWDRVKKKVKEGTFQPIGGSWVEHDTNLPSGESLVRQFLYGQRFFESHFGERSKTFWLPDTFGYSSQLPQLCRKAGITRFFTQKLSWNNINNFPHTTFNWVSLDGSQVICHMAPCETYTAEAHFGDVKRSMSQHKSMDQDATSILPFGKGDGGGGPTFEHLEKLRRCRGLSDTVGLLPRVHTGNSADDFFARLEHRISEEDLKLVTWYGELYFELHRGTYTSQARMKQSNRRAEIMLRDIEYVATMASIKSVVQKTQNSYRYPKKELDSLWERVLLCQFHDCLPGSCIGMCYDDAWKLYDDVFNDAEVLIQEALNELGFSSWARTRKIDYRRLQTGGIVAVNTLPWERTTLIKASIDLEKNDFEYRVIKGSTGLCTPLTASESSEYRVSLTKTAAKDEYLLDNARLRVTVTSGLITSIYDKHADREVIPSGQKANQYVLFDDKPLYWQAWDVEVYHLESRQELKASKISIKTDHQHLAALEVVTPISSESSIHSIISLAAVASPSSLSYVEVQCEVKWRENKKFLKVEVPVDVRNTEASYETQYGIIRRPTHYNTTWDMAKFEVCSHKWADLSEATYGVSILNDSKYGFATQGNVMRLSLLRAPKAPDAHADMHEHSFRYAIMPHEDPLGAQTVREAYNFNSAFFKFEKTQISGSAETLAGASDPSDYTLAPYICTHPAPESVASLLGSLRMSKDSSSAIILSCVKRGEDDEDVSVGDIEPKKGKRVVVRLYDSLGGRCRGKVEFGDLPVKEVQRCNLLEDEGGEVKIDHEARAFNVEVGTFEVQTYSLLLEV